MQAQLVKPSTPVVIKFRDNKNITLHADIVVRLFPQIAPLVKQLKADTDKKDGRVRALLDLSTSTEKNSMTFNEAMRLASYTCGGAYDQSMFFLFKKYGIPFPEGINISITLPSVSLMVKGGVSSGAITVLTLRGDQDIHWVTGCKSIKTFGGAFPEMPDSLYSVATQTLLLNAGKFTISRNGDMAHTFVLKAELVGPTDLDTLFDHISLVVGGKTFVELDLQTNNVLAKAYGLWPSKNNDAPRQTDQKWVATIPIVLRETTAYTKIVMPLIALCWHECAISISGIKNSDAKFALDVDYIYLERAARKWLVNKGGESETVVKDQTDVLCGCKPEEDQSVEWSSCKPEEKWPEDKSSSANPILQVTINQKDTTVEKINPLARASGHEFFFTQFQTVREFLPLGMGNKRRIPLTMKHPTSGFLITLSPEDSYIKQTGNNIAPIISAAIEFNGNRAMEFDLADLTEWNWIKCGMKPPADFCTLLLPGSREMFWADQRDDVFVCPSTVNLSRLDSVTLILTINDDMFQYCGWNATIAAVSTNVSRCKNGMEGVLYAR